MSTYLLRRFLVSVALVWGVLTVTFFVAHLAPGDPVDLMVDPETAPEDVDRMRERFGLDQPLPVQYLRWLGAVAQGDLGVSLSKHRPVVDVLGEALPHTLRLTVAALVLHYLVGTAMGVWMATRRGRLAPRAVDLVSLVLYSLPTFWLGLMLQLVFAYHLRWLPSGGLPGVSVADVGWPTWWVEQFRHLALPVFVLGLSGTASVARTLRASMLDVLSEDYVRTARAKGLSNPKVFYKHALRPASITLVTLVGLSVPFLLGGAVATEVVFGWPGMGRVAVEAILSRDYPLILATTALSATLVVLGNFLADVAYVVVDPRIRTR